MPRGSRQPVSHPTNLLSSVGDDRPTHLLDSKLGESPGALWDPEPLLACLVQPSQWQEGCAAPSPCWGSTPGQLASAWSSREARH